MIAAHAMAPSSVAAAMRPSECSDAELDAFAQFVIDAGEVQAGGMRVRVGDARALCFLVDEAGMLGSAGLKRPTPNHRREVEQGAGVALPADAFRFELGWVVVAPRALGSGKSLALCAPLVDAERSSGIFATSRADNPRMHATLARLGFARTGGAWPSGLNPADLWLFARLPD